MTGHAGPAELLAMTERIVDLLGPAPTGELGSLLASIREQCLAEFNANGNLTKASHDSLAMAAILALGEREEHLGRTVPAREFIESLLWRGEEWSG